ncbi:MAG: SPOR domain-containing protein [Gammaproteobacteria bacterium]|nr:SPOR domain-containing protein [Gammaproteobacteria bacterium]
METRNIQGIIISFLLVAGLSACSTSSSYSGGDSPWKAKRDAERANAPTEEFVEVGLDQAVEVNAMEEMPVAEEAMARPGMVEADVMQPELETVADFNPEPVPVETMSTLERLELEAAAPQQAPMEMIEEVVPVSAGSDIMSAPSGAYAVQVFAGRRISNVKRYQETHGLSAMQIVATDHGGETIHVLVGIYADRSSARQAAEDIEASTGSRPWVRSVAGLKSMAVQ